MGERFRDWRELKWWQAAGVCIILLVLAWCGVSWRAHYQQIATAVLEDVYEQATVDGSEILNKTIFRIRMEGEGGYEGEYRVAELSDEQFARLKRTSASWEERKAEVTAKNWELIRESYRSALCGNTEYGSRKLKKSHVYQIRDRSCYYLLVEDRESGKEYVAKFQSHYCDNGEVANTEDILRGFLQIRGEGDISKITLEDTRVIEEGDSNILGVYTKKADKKQCYKKLCEITTTKNMDEDALMYATYGDLTEEQEKRVKQDSYLIEVENKQGEMYVFQYQETEKVDYLILQEGVDLPSVFPVQEEQKTFGRQVFAVNARPEDTKPLTQVANFAQEDISLARYYFPDECEGNEGTISFSYDPLYGEEDEEQSKELYDRFLQAPVGPELFEVEREKQEGACWIYQEVVDGEIEVEDRILEITKYPDYIKIQDNRPYPAVKRYFCLTGEMEELFEQGRKYAEETYDTAVKKTNSDNIDNILDEKPIIYLYPDTAKDIHVEVKNVDFTTVYPAYDRGWHVRAEKDGTLHLYLEDGKTLDTAREYYALYYEGISNLKPDWQSGFTVEKKDYQKFLEEKLRILGLSDREAEEFIVYWLPQMEKYPAVDIHFTEQTLLDKKVPLTISPKPDTLIRVFMQWRRHVDGENLPREQMLQPVAREGYTAVEWGGSNVRGGQ